MITLLLMSLTFFVLGILFGYRWCMVSEPTKKRLLDSFDSGYQRATLFYKDFWPSGERGDYLVRDVDGEMRSVDQAIFDKTHHKIVDTPSLVSDIQKAFEVSEEDARVIATNTRFAVEALTLQQLSSESLGQAMRALEELRRLRVVKNDDVWPHGDPKDIRSYTPGPGPKPRSKGPADYVDGHEMGSHPGDCHGICCSGEMGS